MRPVSNRKKDKLNKNSNQHTEPNININLNDYLNSHSLYDGKFIYNLNSDDNPNINFDTNTKNLLLPYIANSIILNKNKQNDRNGSICWKNIRLVPDKSRVFFCF